MSALSPSILATLYTTLIIVGGAGVAILASRSSRRRQIVPQEAPKEISLADVLATLVTEGGNENFRIQGDLHVRADLAFPHGLVVEGSLTVADGVRFDAPVEVIGTVILGQGSRIGQPLVVHGGLKLGRNARVGPTHVDGDVLLQAGAAIEGPLQCHALYLEEDERPLAAPPPIPAGILFEGEPPLDTHELASR